MVDVHVDRSVVETSVNDTQYESAKVIAEHSAHEHCTRHVEWHFVSE